VHSNEWRLILYNQLFLGGGSWGWIGSPGQFFVQRGVAVTPQLKGTSGQIERGDMST